MNKKLERILVILGIIVLLAVVLSPARLRFFVIFNCAKLGAKSLYGYVGTCYYKGRGCVRDMKKARYFWEKAAWLGDYSAQRHLGDLFSRKLGFASEAAQDPAFWENIPVNYEKAFEWYFMAGEKGEKNSQCRLGYFYAKGIGVKRDYFKSFCWYKKSALQDVLPAQCWLGHYYSHALGIERHFDMDPNKWFGVDRDYSEAVRWYTKAAERGAVGAQTRVAYLYSHGEGAGQQLAITGVKKDLEKAIEWYTKAADQGDDLAQYRLGNLALIKEDVLWNQPETQNPIGSVTKSLRIAFEWYCKAAEQGFDIAQRRLGYMYYVGNGVEQDFQQAFEWSMKAAQQGDADAQCQVGYLYEHGEGVEKNPEQALVWYTKAAEQGDALAQFYAARLTYRTVRPEDEFPQLVEEKALSFREVDRKFLVYINLPY